MSGSVYIGIDLGGTKIKIGTVSRKGELLSTPIKIKTGAKDPAKAILARIVRSIVKVTADLGLTVGETGGIGIGCTGPVDIATGRVLECPQLPTMHFYPLRDAVEDHFNVPVVLNNDANCLVYGECLFGAASDKKDIVGFTLGTGIGCAIVLNKKIFTGSTGTAAEIWPSPYKSGIIEDYISGYGISKIYQSISGKEETSIEIFKLAEAGDKNAIRTWHEFGSHLAVPIAWAINLIDPEVVVLGGSIAAAYPYFKASMEGNLRKWICPVPAERTAVVLSKLGADAGVIGAACLVMPGVGWNRRVENRREAGGRDIRVSNQKPKS